jgi:hypothetical protein
MFSPGTPRTANTPVRDQAMGAKKAKQKLQAWSEARARHHLTDAQVRMARELGMNPARLRKVDHGDQERWKSPLPEFIEETYRKRFGKAPPEGVKAAAERAREEQHPKKKSAHTRQERSPPTGRESRESPRGSTIPPFPKPQIDD